MFVCISNYTKSFIKIFQENLYVTKSLEYFVVQMQCTVKTNMFAQVYRVKLKKYSSNNRTLFL